MKRITALITVLTILFSMAVPVWAADVAVSVGKSISALVNPDAANDAKANDDNMGSWYVGSKANASNALTIDLEKKYILSSVTALILNQNTYSISVSNDENFGTSTELQLSGTQWVLPAANADQAYRYVRLSFTTTSSTDVWVFDFKAYTTPENAEGAGAQIERPAEFEGEILNVSVGKPILSKVYGSGGYDSAHKVANANDDSSTTSFISTPQHETIDWITLDLQDAVVINKVVGSFTANRDYGVYVTNTAHGQTEELTDGILLEETAPGSKVFTVPEEHKTTAYRYVRLRFDICEDDNPNSDTENNMYVSDISVYKSSRDVIYNAAELKHGALTDGNTNTAVTVANNTVIDLLAPTYIHSYELFGTDKGNVTIKGSLFNTTVDNMTVIPEHTTSDEKYRFIAIESNNGEPVSLNEIKVNTFFTDVVTPWELSGTTCKTTVTNTSHKDNRTYTFTATAFDEYGSVMGVKTVTEELEAGVKKDISLDVPNADLAKRIVCTVEKNGILVSAPEIFVNGVKVAFPTGTPYTTAPTKDFEVATTKTDYVDGLELTVSNAGGMTDSDMLTFSVYDPENKLLARDAAYRTGTFKYRLAGNAAAGTYKVIIAATDAMGANYSQEHTFTKTTPTESELTTAIDAFKNAATAADFDAAYQTHYVTNGTISFSDIPEAEALLSSGIGDSFIRMKTERAKWKKNPSDTFTVEDVRDCLKAAVIENSLENGSSNASVVLTKYASVMDNVFSGEQNNAYTAEIYNPGAATFDEMINNMKIAAALSLIKNASSETIKTVLSNYDDILEVDLGEIADKNVDLLLVAKRIKDLIPETNVIPESFKDGLAEEIAQILLDNAIPDDNNNNNNNNVSTGGGGGGGGGYTGENTDVIVKEDYPLPTMKPAEDVVQPETVTFNDVSDKYWAADSIKKLATAGIISGRGDGSYDPNSQVSRAEFATMLVKAFGLVSDPEKKPEFSDCKVSDWYYPFVDAAVSNNIVSGISKTAFDPVSSIRRQDACVMSYNIMIYKNYLKFFEGKTFTDSNSVSQYAEDAVNMLSGSGVISGFEDGSFGPYEILSRAQAAVIVDKLMTLLGEEA